MCIWSERSRCLRLSQLVHFHESVRVLHIHRYTHPHGATNQLPRAVSQKQKALSHLSSHCSDKIQIEISRCVKEIMLLWPESIIQKYASALKSLIEVLSRHFGFLCSDWYFSSFSRSSYHLSSRSRGCFHHLSCLFRRVKIPSIFGM